MTFSHIKKTHLMFQHLDDMGNEIRTEILQGLTRLSRGEREALHELLDQMVQGDLGWVFNYHDSEHVLTSKL